MRRPPLVLLIISIFAFVASSKADFDGSTYILSSATSFYVAATNVSISSIVPNLASTSTLIISNAATVPIAVDWAVGGHAIGSETTNHLLLPASNIVSIAVNAAVPGVVTYSTQPEHSMPVIASAPVVNSQDIIPELLYYKMTESAQSNPPIYLADSSLHGGTTGTVSSGYVVAWVTNAASTPQSAIHFNGVNTAIDTGNNTLFNFTTNLFSINIWVRPLILSTQPVPIGNGSYYGSGWYVFLSPIGSPGIAANGPGYSTYVATLNPCTSPQVWTMLTFVRTSSTVVSIYANGVLQPTVGAFADPASCSDNLILGAYHPFSLHLDGDVGTVRIYNRPLTTNEITKLYGNGISGAIP